MFSLGETRHPTEQTEAISRTQSQEIQLWRPKRGRSAGSPLLNSLDGSRIATILVPGFDCDSGLKIRQSTKEAVSFPSLGT